jgi:nucleoside-diphosphate-sugar epimerase
MDVLVIGGNRFMGRALVWRLLAAGHRVTLLNRGRAGDPFGDRVERLRADRSTDDFDRALAARRFDRAVDFAGFTAEDLARAARVLGGRVGHYVLISTGQVYLVRTSDPRPAREHDYAGPVLAAPPTPADADDWAYGIGKRGAEDALAAAAAALPSTRLRLPMVAGPGDPKRRLEAYLWRLLDGGPLLVTQGGAIARHVYAGAVVRVIAAILDAPPPPGGAYNLAQREEPTVRELVERVAARAGVSAAAARARIAELPPGELEAAGVSPRLASPWSSRWMSHLDPGRAVAELGLSHPPLDDYLDACLAALAAGGLGEPPAGYAEQRAAERALAARA